MTPYPLRLCSCVYMSTPRVAGGSVSSVTPKGEDDAAKGVDVDEDDDVLLAAFSILPVY